MFNKLGWLTVSQLIFYHSVISVHKIRNSREPEYLSDILTRDNKNERISIPNIDLRLTQKSFTMRGAENWNSIPQNIRNQNKIGCFKKLVRKWITENVPRFIE